jgi:phage-related protein
MVHSIIVSLPKPTSLNEYYAGKHWSSRSRSTKQIRGIVKVLLLEQGQPPFSVDTYSISLRSNGRTDIDNRIMAIKWLNDCMEKDLKWVRSDNPKVFKRFEIEQVDELEKDEFQAKITFYGR